MSMETFLEFLYIPFRNHFYEAFYSMGHPTLWAIPLYSSYHPWERIPLDGPVHPVSHPTLWSIQWNP